MNKFKVVFLGNSQSGKTSLINLFLNKPNPLSTTATTIGSLKHNTQIYGQNCEFLFVDTSGNKGLNQLYKAQIHQQQLFVMICILQMVIKIFNISLIQSDLTIAMQKLLFQEQNKIQEKIKIKRMQRNNFQTIHFIKLGLIAKKYQIRYFVVFMMKPQLSRHQFRLNCKQIKTENKYKIKKNKV